MFSPGIRVVKITRTEAPSVHVQIAGQDIEVLWADISVGWVTDTRLKFPEQNCVTTILLQRQQLDKSPRERQRFPASVAPGEETEP